MNNDLSSSKRVKDSAGHASTSTDGAAKKRSKHDRSAAGDIDGLRVTQESRKQKKLVTLPEGGRAETPPVSQEPNYTSLGASSAGSSKVSKSKREKEESDDTTSHTSSRRSGVEDDADAVPKKHKKKSGRPERSSMPVIQTNWRETEAAQAATPRASLSLQTASAPLAASTAQPAQANLTPAYDDHDQVVQEENTALLSTPRRLKPGGRRSPTQVHDLLTKPSAAQSVPDATPITALSEASGTSTTGSFKDNLAAALQAGSLSPRGAQAGSLSPRAVPQRSPIQRSATEASDPVTQNPPADRVVGIQTSTPSRHLARSMTDARESATSSIVSTPAKTFALNLPVLTPLAHTSRMPRSPRSNTVTPRDSPALPIASPAQSPRKTPEAKLEVAVAETPSTPVAAPLSSPRTLPETAGKGTRILPATPTVPQNPAANVDYSLGANAKLDLLESKGYSSLLAGSTLLKLTRTLERLFPGADMVSDRMLEQAIDETKFSTQEKLMMIEVGVKCMQTPDILGTEAGSYKLQNMAIRAAKFLCAKLGDSLNG